MVLSRGLRDEVKTAFWGRAVDRQVVGLAPGWRIIRRPHVYINSLPTPALWSAPVPLWTSRLPSPRAKGKRTRIYFYFGFYPIPRDTTLRTDGQGTVNIGNGSKPHSKLRPSTIEPPVAFPLRYILMVPADGISGRSPDLGAKLARHS